MIDRFNADVRVLSPEELGYGVGQEQILRHRPSGAHPRSLSKYN